MYKATSGVNGAPWRFFSRTWQKGRRKALLLGLLIELILFSLYVPNQFAAGAPAQVERQSSPAIPDVVTTLYAVADATILEAFPGTNVGDSSRLTVERDDFLRQSIAFVQFVLTSIPPGSTINSASLRMRVDTAYNGFPTVDISAGRVTESWNEMTINWNNQPATNCCDAVSSVGFTLGEYASWDLTSLVDAWVNNPSAGRNYGVALAGPGTGHQRGFASRETVALPYLQLDYTPPPPDGAIVATMLTARTSLPNQDDPTCPPLCWFPWEAPEDFYPQISANDGPLLKGPTISNRSYASWEPGGFSVTGPVIKAMRTFPVHMELFEDDDIGGDVEYDISPAPGKPIDAIYDGCTQRWTIDGIVFGPGPSLVPASMASGISGLAQVKMNIANSDGKSFAPNDVSIVDIQPVQVVYDAEAIVADKATSLMVDLSSSWPVTRNVDVMVSMSDGGVPVSQTKNVNVPPGGARLFFFDGSDGVLAFRPLKNPPTPTLAYTATLSVDQPEGSPDWQACVYANNTASGTMPVIKIYNPPVVYRAWDFTDGTSLPSPGAVVSTSAANEPFRLATFPISDTVSFVAATPSFTPFGRGTAGICELLASALPIPHPPPFFCGLVGELDLFSVEPGQTLFWENQAAVLAGIQKLVLMPSATFWESEAGRLAVGGPTTIGLSLGEYGSHVVIAEAGTSQTVVHELAHTYTLSQRNCTNGGLPEILLHVGCRDEYLFAPGDGAPFLSSGFDVNGMIYPGGQGGEPGTREINGVPNIMGTTGTANGMYDRWIDTPSYNVLLSQMRDLQDPALVNISGFLWAENGLEATDAIIYGVLTTNYQFDGIPDIPQPKLDEPSGVGLFSAHLETAQGDRIYRFNPQFRPLTYEGHHYGDFAFFSFNVQWEPDLNDLSLWGPAGPIASGNYQEVELFHKVRSVAQPVVNSLIASVNNQPVQGSAVPPSATLGDKITLNWVASDADSVDLRATLLLRSPVGVGTYQGWLPYAVELEGDSFTLPAEWLLKAPGLYDGRIVVSDGVNSTTYDQPGLFKAIPPKTIFMPIMLTE